MTTQAGSKTISIEVGSRYAQVDGNRVALDAPAFEASGTIYAPLRFFTDALAAQTNFDRRTKTVTIVAQLIGRSDYGLVTTGTGYARLGTVAAVDVLSNPPTSGDARLRHRSEDDFDRAQRGHRLARRQCRRDDARRVGRRAAG